MVYTIDFEKYENFNCNFHPFGLIKSGRINDCALILK